jgi:hypothetical protein
MTHKLSVLGLVVMALGGMVAQAASADKLEAESYPVVLTGTKVPHTETSTGTVKTFDLYKNDVGTYECKQSSYIGAQSSTDNKTTITLSVSRSECVFVGLKVVVDMNECDYRFRIGGSTSTTGTLDIICPAGKEITETVFPGASPSCIIHIPPQEGLVGITYSNLGVGTTREITVKVDISTIKYSMTEGIGIARCATVDNTTNGVWEGAFTLTGEVDPFGAHVGLFLAND